MKRVGPAVVLFLVSVAVVWMVGCSGEDEADADSTPDKPAIVEPAANSLSPTNSQPSTHSSVAFVKLVQTARVGFYCYDSDGDESIDDEIIIRTQNGLLNLNSNLNLSLGGVDFSRSMVIGVGKDCSYSAAHFSIDSVNRVGDHIVVTVTYEEVDFDPDIVPAAGYDLSICPG